VKLAVSKLLVLLTTPEVVVETAGVEIVKLEICEPVTFPPTIMGTTVPELPVAETVVVVVFWAVIMKVEPLTVSVVVLYGTKGCALKAELGARTAIAMIPKIAIEANIVNLPVVEPFLKLDLSNAIFLHLFFINREQSRDSSESCSRSKSTNT
jgi:hypothetical protein